MSHSHTRLRQTYEECRGGMLLKKDVHAAYMAFCKENLFEATTNAAFGKLFKRVFPEAEIRRVVKQNETTFFYDNMAAKTQTPVVTSTRSDALTDTLFSVQGGNSRKRARNDEADTVRRTTSTTGMDSPNNTQESTSLEPNLQWSREAKLIYSDTLNMFLELYRTELWALWPINPSILNYSLLFSIFNVDDQTVERSALSVGAHFVVSMGQLFLIRLVVILWRSLLIACGAMQGTLCSVTSPMLENFSSKHVSISHSYGILRFTMLPVCFLIWLGQVYSLGTICKQATIVRCITSPCVTIFVMLLGQ